MCIRDRFGEVCGMPGMFFYDAPVDLSAARELLNPMEFLAPHFAILPDGSVWVMVAPHLIVDGAVIKKIGPDDHFIVIRDGKAERFDYSTDCEGMM